MVSVGDWSRIYGGTRVHNPNPYPWTVHLDFRCGAHNSTRYYCGGVAIQRNVVLTAAHCWLSCTNVFMYVTVGLNFGEPDQKVVVQKRVANPDYSSNYHNDIAILFTSTDLKIPKFPFIFNDTDPSVNTSVTVTGWGVTKLHGSIPTSMREAELLIQSDETCTEIYTFYYDNITQICAGYPNRDTCPGDSGGPLFEITDCCKYPGTILYGITSVGIGCEYIDISLYTKISYYYEWILSVISENGFEVEINEPSCCACDDSPLDIGNTTNCSPAAHHHPHILPFFLILLIFGFISFYIQ
jgi:secreted trypsin-like serine protease